MKALVVDRKVVRFGAAMAASRLKPGSGASVGVLSLDDIDPPELPGPDWVRLSPRMSGICGSDLATVDGRSSRWFEPIVSFPFVPGHEVVADDPDGNRVVIEPVLGCVTRGVEPVCEPCANGNAGNCANLAHGCLSPGLQTGYCCDTGGGWSTGMVAHPSQLHSVPDEMSDHAAVLVEPAACAVHAALRAQVQPDESVAVIGAGTLGLMTLAALDRWSPAARIVIGAKYDHQRRLAREFSARSVEVDVVDPARLARRVRSVTGTTIVGPDTLDPTGWVPGSRLGGGVDVTIDCVGSAESIEMALAVTRPRGRIILVGMPGVETLDMTPLWQREISLVGAYTYGTEHIGGSPVRTFELAMELVASARLERLVSSTYSLDRFTDALEHAASAGIRGGVKIAFDNIDPDNGPAPKLTPRKGTRR